MTELPQGTTSTTALNASATVLNTSEAGGDDAAPRPTSRTELSGTTIGSGRAAPLSPTERLNRTHSPASRGATPAQPSPKPLAPASTDDDVTAALRRLVAEGDAAPRAAAVCLPRPLLANWWTALTPATTPLPPRLPRPRPLCLVQRGPPRIRARVGVDVPRQSTCGVGTHARRDGGGGRVDARDVCGPAVGEGEAAVDGCGHAGGCEADEVVSERGVTSGASGECERRATTTGTVGA